VGEQTVNDSEQDTKEDGRTFMEMRPDSVAAIEYILKEYAKYHSIFRGQGDADWNLSTRLERAMVGLSSASRAALEGTMLVDFKRRAHHYLSQLPHEDNLAAWLGLMQHYGCPTRLLDFTRSPYVALFFAIEEARKDSAVWVMNTRKFEGVNSRSFWERTLEPTYSSCFEKEADSIIHQSKSGDIEPGIIPFEPFWVCDRFSIQMALFLLPKKADSSFEENMCSAHGGKTLKELGAQKGYPQVIKVVIPVALRDEVVHLLSMMNITAQSLFPGLDGFARSFTFRIAQVRRENAVVMRYLCQSNEDRRQGPVVP
jgi:hypothetical protein